LLESKGYRGVLLHTQEDIISLTSLVTPTSRTTGSNTMSNEDDVKPIIELSAASVKLPSLWANHIEVWFARAEAEFTTAGVKTEASKFAHVAKVLTEEQLVTCFREVTKPKPGSEYTDLRCKLIKSMRKKPGENMLQLLYHERIGDLTPTAFLNRLLPLVSEADAQSDLFKEMYIIKLPADIKGQLTTSLGEAVEDIAEKADAVYHALRVATAISAAARAPVVAAVHSDDGQVWDLASIGSTLANMSQEIAALKSSAHQPWRNSGGGYGSAGKGSGNSEQFTGMCKYHRKFGDKAWKCTVPCVKNGKVAPAPTQSSN
jgi:hypothetical protein